MEAVRAIISVIAFIELRFFKVGIYYNLVFRDKIVAYEVYTCGRVADIYDIYFLQGEFQTEMKKMAFEPSVGVVFFLQEAQVIDFHCDFSGFSVSIFSHIIQPFWQI